MNGPKKYYFIINPISGKGKGKLIIPMIDDFFGMKNISYEVRVTQFAGEAKVLAKDAIQNGFNVIVAVGGDGTVNEIGSVLAGSEIPFGIIPIGSGNGLARELNIPLDTKAAIRNLVNGSLKKIDTGTCNGKFFACTAGIGFDADMAQAFLELKNRGLLGYVRTFLKEFFQYKTKKYHIQSKDLDIKVDAFLITIANCRQWGNEFYISPTSKHNDGKFEICILRRFPLILFPVLLFRIISKTIHRSRFVSIISVDSIELFAENESIFHMDGEVSAPQKIMKIQLFHKNLTTISGF